MLSFAMTAKVISCRVLFFEELFMIRPVLVLALFALAGCAAKSSASYDTHTTLKPAWTFEKPEHYEFLSYESLHHPQEQHPAQWKGQDWEPSRWNSRWTPSIVLKKFFDNGVFETQHVGADKVFIVEIGSTFYKLSDLDRRRALKLLADETGVLNQGFDVIELHDEEKYKPIGIYTAKGMFLY